MVEALKTNATLTQLNLRDNDLSKMGMEAIAEALNARVN